MYGRGTRFALVRDLVDAGWTRCTPPSGFRLCRAETCPAGPTAAGLRVRSMSCERSSIG
jgi:hypothetical protein